MTDLQSFKTKVIDACEGYVKHMQRTDVDVANVKHEVDQMQSLVEKNCDEYFSSRDLTKKYASKSKVKELSKAVKDLEGRMINESSGGIKQETTSDYSEADSDMENCSTDPSSASDTDIEEDKQKETEESANDIIKRNWYEFAWQENGCQTNLN